MIMLEAVKAAEKRLNKRRRKKLTIDARYYFVDKSRPVIDYLKNEFNRIRCGAQFDNPIQILEGKFEDLYESITSDILAKARAGRSIFLLDQFGAYSGPNRPLIPIESGHLFRGKPAGDSGAK